LKSFGDKLKVPRFTHVRIITHTTKPVWLDRFLTELGLDPDTPYSTFKGMTATVTKDEWRAMFTDSRYHVHNRNGSGGEQPRKSTMVYNNMNYSALKPSMPSQTPCNKKVSHMTASTAHAAKGRDVGVYGKVFILADDQAVHVRTAR
jgi:hypothetical protein